MEEKEVLKALESIAKVFQKSPSEIQSMYQAELKNSQDAYDMPLDQAREFATNRVFAILRNKQLENKETFEVVITGTDGRVSNWADYTRGVLTKEIAELQKAGKTKEDLIALGFMNTEGKYLYPKSDQYRAGKVVPDQDLAVSFEGVVKYNGKFVKGSFRSRDPAVLEFIGKKKMYKVTGTKNKKSTENEVIISVTDKSAFSEAGELPFANFVKACEMLNNKFEANFDRLLTLSDNIPQDVNARRVTIKDVEIANVRKDIGKNKTIVATVSVPGKVYENMSNPRFREMNMITVWIPKELDFVPMQYQRISFSGNISPPDKEKGLFVVNAVSVWCDEKELKEKPKLPEEKPKEASKPAGFDGW